MTDADIFYREPGTGWRKYCIRSGTRKEIEETARDLLKSLREESARSSVKIVWPGNRTTMVRLQSGAAKGA
jgi:hypothetical protein